MLSVAGVVAGISGGEAVGRTQAGSARAGDGYWLRLALVAVGYYVAARLSLELSLVGRSVTPLWAPTAVTVAALAVNLPIGPSPAAAVGIAAGNTLAPLAAAWMLRRLRFDSELGSPRDALALVAAGTLATTVSATGGSLALMVSGAAGSPGFGSTWLVWWTGDAMGILLVAPVLWSLPRARPVGDWGRVVEAFCLLALLVAAVLLVASRADPGLSIVLLPLIWVAWRFKQEGAAPAALLASVLVTVAVVYRRGVFAGETLAHSMIVLQCFNATVALTSLFSAAAIAERDRVTLRLRQIAQVAQEAVIRPPAPSVGPVVLAARYESATEEAAIGGDLYEVVDTAFGVRLVIGDVRGKGLGAVQAAAAAVRSFRRAAYSAPALSGLVETVASETAQALEDEEEFITALFAEVTRSGRLRLVNLGHPAPLYLRGRVVRTLEPRVRSLPMGVTSAPVSVDEFDFGPGDRLLLFTDGLSEGRDRSGEFFPLRRVAAEALESDDLEDALDQIMTRYRQHVSGQVDDDIAVLAVAWQPVELVSGSRPPSTAIDW